MCCRSGLLIVLSGLVASCAHRGGRSKQPGEMGAEERGATAHQPYPGAHEHTENGRSRHDWAALAYSTRGVGDYSSSLRDLNDLSARVRGSRLRGCPRDWSTGTGHLELIYFLFIFRPAASRLVVPSRPFEAGIMWVRACGFLGCSYLRLHATRHAQAQVWSRSVAGAHNNVKTPNKNQRTDSR